MRGTEHLNMQVEIIRLLRNGNVVIRNERAIEKWTEAQTHANRQ